MFSQIHDAKTTREKTEDSGATSSATTRGGYYV